MKQILTLVALSLVFIGIAAAETNERKVCPDTVCTVAEAQGLCTDLDQLSSSISEVKTTLDKCGRSYCQRIDRNANDRSGLISEAQRSAQKGDFNSTVNSLEEVREIVFGDIQSSERELEEGRTEREIVREVLTLEKDILMQTESALRKSQQALVVKTAIECPDDRCGAEVSQVAKKNSNFKAGAELSKTSNAPQDRPDDADSDGDGLNDGSETDELASGDEGQVYAWGRNERSEASTDDGTIYCWGSSCKAPTETSEIGDTNPVYCWGKCELPSEVMQPDYDGEVYCWGNRCEPPTEKADGGGKVYSWGRGLSASETLDTDPSNIENSSEEAQESISKRTARTGRNPETGKEIQSEGDSEDEFESDTEGEISDGVNPVNDPPTASPDDSIRNSVSRGFGRLTSAFGNLFGR